MELSVTSARIAEHKRPAIRTVAEAALEILYEQVTSEGLLPTNHVPSHEIGTNASVVIEEPPAHSSKIA
jgi:hypothetical protein